MEEVRSGRRMSPSVGTALTAGVVCVACYVGSALDATLCFPQINTAILFPPYAILTAALLLAPPRRWWAYLLASSLGNYLPHQQGWPISWVLLAEVANLFRALLAAGGIRYFNAGSVRFDSLRGVAAFLLFAVFLAPATAAFAGAGLVVLHGGAEDFWLVWQAWFLSNALTALTLLPIIVIGITNGLAWMTAPHFRPIIEAAMLAIGLFSVGILLFAGPYSGSNALPARLYAPLAFLLWAAVRFGPAGTSASLLAIT